MKVIFLIGFLSFAKGLSNLEHQGSVEVGGVKCLAGGGKKEGGKFKFEDTIDVEIELRTGAKRTSRLKKQKVDTTQGISFENSAVYGNNDDIILREECTDDDIVAVCKEYALVREVKHTKYFKSRGKALALENKRGFIDGITKAERQIRRRRRLEKNRTVRAVADGFLTSRAVKLAVFVDKGMIDIFTALNNNDTIAGKDDIIHYLLLVSNEMTLHFQSLLDYGRNMTVDGVVTSMDIAVDLVWVEFPPENSTDGHFDFTRDFIVGNDIYNYKEQQLDGTYISYGVFKSFNEHLKSHSVPVLYDHAMLVTGYNFKKLTTFNDGTTKTANYLGLAYLGTLCKTGSAKNALHMSMSELGGGLSRIMTHEVAHGLGANHDVANDDPVNCPNLKYLMAGSLFRPKGESIYTYHKFSPCSAANIEEYTNGIKPRYFIDTCLMPPDEALLTRFCQGYTGYILSLDEQCKLQRGVASYRYPDDDPVAEAHLQAGYVKYCIANDDFTTYPFRCKKENKNGFHKQRLAATGTKCLDENGAMNPNYACFNGQCVSRQDACQTV